MAAAGAFVKLASDPNVRSRRLCTARRSQVVLGALGRGASIFLFALYFVFYPRYSTFYWIRIQKKNYHAGKRSGDLFQLQCKC